MIALSHPVSLSLRLVIAGASERLSIPIRLGNSGVTENYLFDTGSGPLVAAYTSGAPWWGEFTATGQTHTLHYVFSGFQFSTVQIPITVGEGNQSLTSSPSFPVNQAQVRLIKKGGSWVEDSHWTALLQIAVQSGRPPEDGGNFYGTLGADPGNPDVGLCRLVKEACSGGKVIAGFALEGGLRNPHFTLGLTPPVESHFPIQMSINRVNGKLAQKVITADFSLEYRGRV